MFDLFKKKVKSKVIKITYDGRGRFTATCGDSWIGTDTKKQLAPEISLYMLNSGGPFVIDACGEWNVSQEPLIKR